MVKILELFSGYGTASFALKRILGEEGYELVGYSDIDKYANQCFKQNHCPNDTNDKLRLGDVTKINPNELPDFDLLTGEFPCQDVSIAGKGDLSKGRTTLFSEIIRIADVKQPRYMLLENVKGLLSKKYRDFYEHTLSELNRIGYEVFMVYDEKHKENRVPVLNTKDFGIPQNRERVWYICFRDVEDLMKFNLPEKEELKIFLKDLLETQVEEKFYLNEKRIKNIIDKALPEQKTSYCIDANYYKGTNLKGFIEKKRRQLVQINTVIKSEFVNNRVYGSDGLSPCLNVKECKDVKIQNTSKIRKLTPKECFRLQGFLNDEIILDGLSDTQCYKLVGNGQSVNVVERILKEMLK